VELERVRGERLHRQADGADRDGWSASKV
jgi:hypothetical protein